MNEVRNRYDNPKKFQKLYRYQGTRERKSQIYCGIILSFARAVDSSMDDVCVDTTFLGGSTSFAITRVLTTRVKLISSLISHCRIALKLLTFQLLYRYMQLRRVI